MIRVFVIYHGEVDPDRYAQHVALCVRIPAQAFRHGKVIRTLFGEPLHYYAEFEFADLETFKTVSATDEFRETGADAAEMGVPHSVYLAELE